MRIPDAAFFVFSDLCTNGGIGALSAWRLMNTLSGVEYEALVISFLLSVIVGCAGGGVYDDS